MPNKDPATPTGSDIQGLTKPSEDLELASADWKSQSKSRKLLDQTCNQKHLDEEVDWIEKNLAEVLDTYAKILKVASFSKRWCNKEVAEARRTWAREKRKWGTVTPDTVTLKQTRNLFYRVVRKAKRQCWQSFLQGEHEDDNINKQESTQDRCWTALRYTQPRQHQTTPSLKGPNSEIATTMQSKEALVRAHAFPKPPVFPGR